MESVNANARDDSPLHSIFASRGKQESDANEELIVRARLPRPPSTGRVGAKSMPEAFAKVGTSAINMPEAWENGVQDEALQKKCLRSLLDTKADDLLRMAQEGDWIHLARAAHSLKGKLSCVYAEDCCAAIQELERATQQRKTTVVDIAQNVQTKLNAVQTDIRTILVVD